MGTGRYRQRSSQPPSTASAGGDAVLGGVQDEAFTLRHHFYKIRGLIYKTSQTP